MSEEASFDSLNDVARNTSQPPIVQTPNIPSHLAEYWKNTGPYRRHIQAEWSKSEGKTLSDLIRGFQLLEREWKAHSEGFFERHVSENYIEDLRLGIEAGLMSWPGVKALYQLCRSEGKKFGTDWLEHWAARVSIERRTELDKFMAMPMESIEIVVYKNIGGKKSERVIQLVEMMEEDERFKLAGLGTKEGGRKIPYGRIQAAKQRQPAIYQEALELFESQKAAATNCRMR